MADSVFEIIHQHYATEAEVSVNSKNWFYSQDTKHITVNDAGTYEHFLNTRDLAGTTDKFVKFTGANAGGDSILSEVGSGLVQTYSADGSTLFIVQNLTSAASALAGFRAHASGSMLGTLYSAPSGYTDNAQATSRLTLESSVFMNGINFNTVNTSGNFKFFIGTMASGTLFTTLSTKGLKLENIGLNTDANGTIAGIDGALTITKNDSNSRQFYMARFKPVLNAGGSNASTTFDILSVDTTNTAVTGITTNLLNLSYGGLSIFKVVGTPDGNNNHNHKLIERLAINWPSTPEMPLHLASDQSTLCGIAMQTSGAPGDPPDANQIRVYLKGARYFVIQYNDSGTVRYKSLDLQGTGVTWAHSTTSP